MKVEFMGRAWRIGLAMAIHFSIFSAPKTMADDKKHTCDESKVKTLSSIEHIRLRTGQLLPFRDACRPPGGGCIVAA